MSIMRVIVSETAKGLRKGAQLASQENARSRMPRLEKAAVTKHDFVKMGEKVERLRSDTHAGMTDLHEAMRANADHVAQHIEKLNTSLSEHAGLVRDLIQLLEHLH